MYLYQFQTNNNFLFLSLNFYRVFHSAALACLWQLLVHWELRARLKLCSAFFAFSLGSAFWILLQFSSFVLAAARPPQSRQHNSANFLFIKLLASISFSPTKPNPKLSLYKLTICFVHRPSHRPPPLLRRAEIIIYFSYSQLGNRNQRTQVESSALFRNLADSEQGLRCEHKTEKRDKTGKTKNEEKE